MRKIKFRAKAVADGKWYCGQLIRDMNSNKCWILKENCQILPNNTKVCIHSDDFVEVLPETVCQFTGCYDKNGEEIYENDIVRLDCKVSEHRHTYGKIVYRKDRFEIQVVRPEYLSNHFYSLRDTEVKVVGNFYSRPEFQIGDKILFKLILNYHNQGTLREIGRIQKIEYSPLGFRTLQVHSGEVVLHIHELDVIRILQEDEFE